MIQLKGEIFIVRTQKFHREDLLKGAYEVVVTEGFSQFKARKIAAKINCSTQPIYREFETIDDFKEAVCQYVVQTMNRFLFKQSISNLSELQKRIFLFAQKNPKAFQHFFLTESLCYQMLKKQFSSYFEELSAAENPDTSLASDFDTFWFTTLGKATLISNNCLFDESA